MSEHRPSPTPAPRRGPRLAALGAALALVLAACGSTAPVSPSAALAPSASPAPAASLAPPASPSPSPNLHGAPDLEARLPDSISGVTLAKMSLSGADFLSTGSDTSRTQLEAMLGQLKASPADLAVATAHDPTGSSSFEEGVFQVKGAVADALLSDWLASQQAAMNGSLEISSTTVSGQPVTKVVDASVAIGGTTYVLAKGDSLFLIVTDDQGQLSEALGKLH